MLAPGRISANAAAVEEFPAGLRVLVVDDDVMCLRILDRMLHRCRYHVTTCCRATEALSLLRELKGSYDVVISDVHMPDMDGFKLLELVGLEMDLPVIMMSADEGTSAVMRGIKHGACDYLIKPVRMEELKNIWQHVIRKKWNGNKELEHSGSLEDSDRNHRVTDDADYASSVNDGAEGTWRSQKKKRDAKEDEDEEEGELESDDPSASKKPRVVWSVELHQQFVCAVNQLGIEKAVPKRILELMNVPGLTRENVASHLQKFRLYLKRLSGVAQHHGGLHNPFCVPLESNSKLGELGSLDFQALVSSGQIPPQTLAALHAELLGRPSGGLVLPAVHKPGILQASSALGPKCIPIESGVAFGQPLLKCQSNISEQFPEVTNYPRLTGTTRGVNTTQNGRMVPYTVTEGSHHAINIRPSSLVVPSLSPDNFQSTVAIPSQDSSSIQSGVAQGSDGVLKNVGMLNEYSARRPVSSSESSCSARTDTNSAWEVYNSSLNLGPATELTDLGSEAKTGTLPNQGHVRYLGFVGKGTCIPSRFAVEDFEPPTNHVSHRKAYVGGDGERVKQGIHLDFTDSSKFGNAVLPPFLANDPMRILSNDGFAGYFLKS